MSDLRYFGTFPFCPKIIESDQEIDSINESIAIDWVGELTGQQYEYQDYFGTLYPLKMELADAMYFFWKLKEIQFSLNWQNSDTNGSIINATNALWDSGLEIDSDESLFLRRVCNEQDQIFWTQRRSQVSPPATFDNDRAIRCFESTVGGYGSIATISSKFSNGSFIPVLDDVDQMLAVLKNESDNPLNPHNYWYYPMIFFESGTVNGLCSFGPLWEYDLKVGSQTFRTKNKIYSSYTTSFNSDEISFSESGIDLFIIENCNRRILPTLGTETCGLSSFPDSPSSVVINGGFNVVTF
jgi:hypothetical protein